MDLLSAARKRGFNGNSTSAISGFEIATTSPSGARIPIITRNTLNEASIDIHTRFGFDPAAMRGPNPTNWAGAHSGNARLMNVNAQLAKQVMPEIDLSGSTLQLADFDLNYIDGLADFVAGLAIAAGVLNADGTLVSEGGSGGGPNADADNTALLAQIAKLQNDLRTSEARNATLSSELREARDYLGSVKRSVETILRVLPSSGGGRLVAPTVKSLREIALSIGAEIDRMSKID